MDKKKKNLRPQTTQPSKRITMQNLPTQLVEMSEKDLQQVIGGVAFGGMGSLGDR